MHCAARFVRATLAFTFVLATASPSLAVERHATLLDTYASLMRSINPKLPAQRSLVYATALLNDARRQHVDPTLMMAVVTVESHWNAAAVSVHGAEGLGQLKPSTARDLGVNPRSASGNLRGLAIYLHRLLALFSAAREPMRAALAGYNAGPEAVKTSGGVAPNGTARRYVGKVLSAWNTMRARIGAASVDENPNAPVLALERAQITYWGSR